MLKEPCLETRQAAEPSGHDFTGLSERERIIMKTLDGSKEILTGYGEMDQTL